MRKLNAKARRKEIGERNVTVSRLMPNKNRQYTSQLVVFSHSGGCTPQLVKPISDLQIFGGTGTHVVLLPFIFNLIWKVADASVGPFLTFDFLCY